MADYTGDPASPSDLDNQIVALYQQYLGRTPSQDEINGMRGNPGGIEGVRQTILESPEYTTRPATSFGDPNAKTPPPSNGGAPPPSGAPPPNLQNDTRLLGPQGPPSPGPDPNNPPGPQFNPPGYTPPPAFKAPPAFQYDPFNAPTADDVLNDPGYRFRLQQGTDAIQRSAAARGVLNTGGTLKDILGYGSDLASTEYGNAYNRALQGYQTNRSNAFDNYLANYGIAKGTYDDNYQTQYKDPFAIQYQGALDSFNAQQHNYDQNQYYQTRGNEFDRTLNFNQQIQNYNQHRNDVNDDFYRRYTLLNYL